MAVVINGDTGISPVTASGTSALVDGMTVGRGAGEVATNTAVGASALAANTTGANNVSVGSSSFSTNSTGSRNSVLGSIAMRDASSSSDNVAVGYAALLNNTANDNVALGSSAGQLNTSGGSITALGNSAMYANTTGSNNTAVGKQALQANTTASNNTAVGYQAGYSNQTGTRNVFLGHLAGYTSTADYNTIVGSQAGQLTSTGTLNTFIGVGSGSQISTGSKNSILGAYGGNSGGLDIRTASNYIVLSDGDGNPAMYFKYGLGMWWKGILAAGAGTYAVKLNISTGEITYDTSSARYKDNIRDSVYGLNAVMQLRSAQFEYKKEGRTDIGFIAEELNEVIPELVIKDEDGLPNAVSYDRMVSVLVKAIQEQQTLIQQLQADVAALKGA